MISKAKALLEVFYQVGPRRVLAAPVFIDLREYLFGDSNDCTLVSVNQALKNFNVEPISRRTADAIVTAFQIATRQPNPGRHRIHRPGERKGRINKIYVYTINLVRTHGSSSGLTGHPPDSRLILPLLRARPCY